jgi:glycosyltransferase involved in cell wall biosynthesis
MCNKINVKVSIIIPVIRETDLFEQVVDTILAVCNHSELKEFIIVVCERTEKESLVSIEKMRYKCKEIGIDYILLYQKLPGMGGAMRDGLEICSGSHTIISNADMALDPKLIPQLIEGAKKYPSDITIVSRHIQKGLIEKGYDKLKLIWNIAAQKFLTVLYMSKITDYTYAYRIAPTALYHSVNWEELKHPFALEGTLKFIRLGCKFHEIPGRQQGGTQSGYGETMLYLPVALRIRFMSKKKILKQN